jgi:vacuolar-type H+-ATPase subunit D/Vma8
MNLKEKKRIIEKWHTIIKTLKEKTGVTMTYFWQAVVSV